MIDKIEQRVRTILDSVVREGDRAVTRFTKRFDGISIEKSKFEVSRDEINAAVSRVDKQFLNACRRTFSQLYDYHRTLIPNLTGKQRPGIDIRARYHPIESVLLYVPGGEHPYPSSVLMCAAPARAAGVPKIYVTTPPRATTPEFLCACVVAGVHRVFRIGGVQAIGAFAYGTDKIPKVDKIVGPGNDYVTCAKKLLYGTVGVDLLAGPSEILLLCDASAPIDFVIADIRAQLEHSGSARSWLITTSAQLARKVRARCKKEIRNDRLSMEVHPAVKQAIARASQIACEHVEVLTRNPQNVASMISSAGAIFIGNYSPVAAGDYVSGPSHVLPTGGTARFSSGLSVADFLKCTTLIKYTRAGLKKDAQMIFQLAKAEGFHAHAESVRIRVK